MAAKAKSINKTRGVAVTKKTREKQNLSVKKQSKIARTKRNKKQKMIPQPPQEELRKTRLVQSMVGKANKRKNGLNKSAVSKITSVKAGSGTKVQGVTRSGKSKPLKKNLTSVLRGKKPHSAGGSPAGSSETKILSLHNVGTKIKLSVSGKRELRRNNSVKIKKRNGSISRQPVLQTGYHTSSAKAVKRKGRDQKSANSIKIVKPPKIESKKEITNSVRDMRLTEGISRKIEKSSIPEAPEKKTVEPVVKPPESPAVIRQVGEECFKKQPDRWSDCGQVFFTGGKAYGIASNLRTVYLGTQSAVQRYFESGRLEEDLYPIQKETLFNIRDSRRADLNTTGTELSTTAEAPGSRRIRKAGSGIKRAGKKITRSHYGRREKIFTRS